VHAEIFRRWPRVRDLSTAGDDLGYVPTDHYLARYLADVAARRL
jgi:hypothetical protein